MALIQLLSCCAPFWGCGYSEWFLLQPVAAFLPTCLYPFGTILRREKPPSVPGRKYKYNGQPSHHWAACWTVSGSSTEMGKPKQCPGSATHPKRCLCYGAVLGIGCDGTTQPGLRPHGCRDGNGVLCKHQRSSSAMSPLSNPWQQGWRGLGRWSSGSLQP